MKERILHGVFPPAVIPFKNQEIYEDGFLRYLDFLMKSGVHGIFLLGTNGEAPLLTLEEKKRIMELTSEFVGNKITVIAGCGAPGIIETLELAKFAERIGFPAIHVVTPYYYPLTQDGIAKYYEKIVAAVELPIVVYHIPSRTGNWIAVDMLTKMVRSERIIGLKDSSGDVNWFYKAINSVRSVREDFSFLAGSDTLIYTLLTLGATGIVSAVSDAFPELVVELYNRFTEGNFKRAMELQLKITRIREIISRMPYIAGVKAALNLRGLDVGEPRLPLIPATSEEMERMKLELREFIP